jgi:predicted protein tyrosine phosphatase
VLAPGFWRWGELEPAVEAVARGSWRHREPPQIRGTGHCVAGLEAALWAVGGADSFEAAVLRAANLGDDADTTAAIAGQLAGARWGWSGIPARWRERLFAVDRIVSLAGALFAAGAGPDEPVDPTWAHDDFLHAWRVDDRLLAGEFPGHPSPERARDKVNVLVDAGVRTFVDLTTPEDRLVPYASHLSEAAEARGLDLRHERFPIPDLGVVEDAAYDDVVGRIDAARARGTVYMHCWGGVGRTGTVVGCVLMTQGQDVESVLDTIRQLRASSRKAGRRSPETTVQLDLLRRRARRS